MYETWMNIIYESTREYIELKDETWMNIIYEYTAWRIVNH